MTVSFSFTCEGARTVDGDKVEVLEGLSELH